MLFIDASRRIRNVPLQDLSSGGLSFQLKGSNLQVGDYLDAKLKFTLDELNLSLKVKLQVRWVNADDVIGCAFDAMGSCQVSTLRHLISSFLSGEIVTFDDTLTTVSRENFTKSRQNSQRKTKVDLLYKIRALVILVFFLGAGLTAFSLVCLKLYDMYFVTHAATAQVASTVFTVTMPRDGSIKSLVPLQGSVKKGAPLAVFQSSLLDLLSSRMDSHQVGPEQLQRFVNKTLKGTLTSPCDCRVQEQLVADGQFAGKGQPVFRLVDTRAKPYIKARFDAARAADIYPGAQVKVRVAGVEQTFNGHIERVMVPGVGGVNGEEIVARIVTDAPLAQAYLDRPAKVAIGSLSPVLSVKDVLAAPKEK